MPFHIPLIRLLGLVVALSFLPAPANAADVVGSVVHAGFNEDLAGGIAGIVSGGLWVLIPGMLLLGLALNLTPCVYPLISVTVAYFGIQTDSSRGRKLWLALCYTFGIAVTFSVLGASAALSGGLFGEAMTKPAVLVAVAGVMVALALSSFGFYQLRLPAALGSKVGRASGGTLGAFSMGMTMGVVAAPCIGPVVVGLLVFVGNSGNALLGLSLFFLLALGLGIPYIGLAMAAGSISRLPKAGDWLEWVEHLFGCVLLAMAIYFVGPLLSEAVEGVLMPVFIALSAVYLAFLDPAGSKLRAFRISRQLAGGAVLALLAVTHMPVEGHTSALAWEEFSTAAYDRARRSGAPFVIEFGADWCLPCKEMEERTFTDPQVVELGRGMSFIEVDMTTTDSYTDSVLETFDVLGAPTTIFFDTEGKEFTRRIGFIGPEDFAGLMRDSGTGAGG